MKSIRWFPHTPFGSKPGSPIGSASAERSRSNSAVTPGLTWGPMSSKHRHDANLEAACLLLLHTQAAHASQPELVVLASALPTYASESEWSTAHYGGSPSPAVVAGNERNSGSQTKHGNRRFHGVAWQGSSWVECDSRMGGLCLICSHSLPNHNEKWRSITDTDGCPAFAGPCRARPNWTLDDSPQESSVAACLARLVAVATKEGLHAGPRRHTSGL